MTRTVEQVGTFRIGNLRMAVPLEYVREVLRDQQITSVPATPASVPGLASLRGGIVTVVDLRARFGLEAEAETAERSAMVVEHDDSQYMLVVDAIGDIVQVDRDAMGPVPENYDPARRRYLKAVYESDDDWVMVVDLPELLAIDL